MLQRRDHRMPRVLLAAAAAVAWLMAHEVRPALAACNVIPSAVRAFRGSVGAVDRPFARPGDWVTLSLSGECAAGADALPETDAIVVTFVFTPSGDTPRQLVTFAQRCDAVATDGCTSPIACVPANSTNGLISLERMDERTLRFRFPDTDALFQGSLDDRTLAGPLSIAVTAIDEPLPCGLVRESCAQSAGTRACVDALYANNGTCNTDPDPTFPHFTALPPPNNYAALCTEPAFPAGPCTGTVDEIRFTIDTAGNVLLPMDWRGVRVDRDAVPVARLLRGSSTVEAFPGSGLPLQVADFQSLGAYSPEGIKLPPLFDPQQNPADPNAATFFGSVDAAETVLRVARGAMCLGGRSSGAPCGKDSDCSGSTCGPGLFDFTSRQLDGVGPVVLRRGACFGGARPLDACLDDASCEGGQCGDFDLVALDPVPLDGLNQSERLNALVMEEAIPDPPQDFNGDGDVVDHVLKLGDRSDGVTQAIGINGSEGRAIARIVQQPFSFPALAAEGDLVAFLEPEPLQAGIDANGNGLVVDTNLRVYRVDGSGAVDLSPSPALAVDAEPILDGRSVAISAGRVFFRRAELDGAPSVVTEEIYPGPPGTTTEDFAFFYTSLLSDDARYAVFTSNLPLVPDDTNFFCNNGFDGDLEANCGDVFVLDRLQRTTTRVSVASDGTEANGASFLAAISPSGRFIAFRSFATNLDSVRPGGFNFLHDQRTQITTRLPLNGTIQALSGDGELILSLECEPIGPDSKRCDERLLDRISGEISLVATAFSALPTVTVDHPFAGALSADGRVVAFWSNLADPVHGTGDGRGGVFVQDRVAGTTEMVSVSSDGTAADAESYLSALSRDGRLVAFDSPATNLVAGDTNGLFDLFVQDRAAGFTTRINVSSDGQQAGEPAIFPLSSLARFGVDGRRVYFFSPADNLAPIDPTKSQNLVHDQRTGQTARVPSSRPVAEGEISPNLFGISSDEHIRAFEVCQPVAGLANCRPGFRFEAVDPVLGDLTGDGDAIDTVLSVLDSSSGEVTGICPASAVSIASGSAAFLRPESAGVAPALALCPDGDGGGSDLNGDGDVDDHVVHLWSGNGAARNLARAATAVALSEQALAALISEQDDGSRDLNGDGDANDVVVQVFPHRSAQGSSRDTSQGSPDDGWINLGYAADTLMVGGGIVAFTTSEANQGDTDLNADGDTADRVVQVFDVHDARLSNIGQAAEDVVVGATGLVAFRTREASQGDQVLNGDGDSDDDVLQVYDPLTGVVLNTGLAVTPCMLEACDPRAPYRVLNDTVKFLTFESEQNADLNGDGDRDDLVVQVLNVRQACHTGSMAGACHTLAATTAGICTNNAQACSSDANCGGGTCFVPPGGCIRDLGTPCTVDVAQACGEGEFCQPALRFPGVGSCRRREGPCRENADCAAPATCSDGGQAFNRLLDPLKQRNGGAAVFTGSGRCVEDFRTECPDGAACGAGAFCEAGTCRREHGSCIRDADCPPGSLCKQDLVQVTAEDRDGDELPDAFDNCPGTPNIMQEDRDGDGVGDACAAVPAAVPGAASDDDGCMVFAPRPVGVVGPLLSLLPAVIVYAYHRRRRSPRCRGRTDGANPGRRDHEVALVKEEYIVERLPRNAMLPEIGGGTTEIPLLTIARHILAERAGRR